jgi:hypothetical protein
MRLVTRVPSKPTSLTLRELLALVWPGHPFSISLIDGRLLEEEGSEKRRGLLVLLDLEAVEGCRA